MNWTEGNLARHSRGRKGKEVLLRQKEHFAKARASLLGANAKTSPPSISFLARRAPSSSPGCQPHSTSHPLPSTKKHAREDNLRQASRYFQDAGPALPSPSSFHQDKSTEDLLRQKRQKLLNRGDWVGTNVQKPLQMEFSQPRVSFGNPWGAPRTRRHASKQRLRHLLGIKASDRQNTVPQPVIRIIPPVTRSQLRVRVGSRERTLGGSSNTSPHSRSYRDVESSTHRAHRHRSERHERRARHDKASSRRHSSAHAHRISAASSQLMVQTPPPLHHPVPYRPSLQQLLGSHSSDSDNLASTKAHVGVQQPDIPASQAEQNQAWRDFVVGAAHDPTWSDSQVSGNQEHAGQREISPGVSQLGMSKGTYDRNEDEVMLPPETEIESAVATDQAVPVQMPASFGQRCSSEDPPACVDAQGGFGSTSMKLTLTSLEPHLSQSDIGSGTPDDKMYKMTSRPSRHSDNVSLLVAPSSSNSLQGELFGLVDILPTFQSQHLDNTNTIPSKQQKFQQEEQHRPERYAPSSQALDPSCQTQEKKPSEMRTHEADNEVWRRFILEGSDEDLEVAFEEARKETAKNLRPSDTATSLDEQATSEVTPPHADHVEASSVSSDNVGIETCISADGNQHSPADVSVTSISHRAVAGGSSPDPLSAPVPDYSDTTDHTGQATAGSSSLLDEFLHRNETWSAATRKKGIAPLNVRTASPDEHGKRNDNFRFARPKPFLGKQMSHIDEQRQIALSAPQVRGKPQTSRRRQKKRVGDGRTSIRQMPNFSSDPIEEVDEDIPTKCRHKPSLFGSLDTQKEV